MVLEVLRKVAVRPGLLDRPQRLGDLLLQKVLELRLQPHDGSRERGHHDADAGDG